MQEDDRDAVRPAARGCRLRCVDRLVLERNDDVHALTDERFGLPLGLFRFEVAKDELEVLSFRPSELREASLQRIQGRRNVIDPDVHQADAADGLRGRALRVRVVEGCEKDGRRAQ